MEIPNTMQAPNFKIYAILYQILFSCLLLLLICLPGYRSSIVVTATFVTNETDRLSLLAIKNSIFYDPLNIMSSWNNSIHFCSWPGVSCSRRHPGRVTVLKLIGTQLVGRLPPHVGNLSFLREINLMDNSFGGEISQEIGRLSRLIHLNLTSNEFEGMIPSNLSHCLNLQVIDLTSNNLVGEIPRWLGNATSLIKLFLPLNYFHGIIPVELGSLSKLLELQLGWNDLSGTIPLSIYNLSSLLYIGLAINRFHGKIAPDIGFKLPNLLGLYVAANQFTGPIPLSLSNASRLEFLSFSNNSFTGTVPQSLGSLTSLKSLGLGLNQLGTEDPNGFSFLTSLTNCTNLQDVQISMNRFAGILPASISNFSSTLEQFSAFKNQISGAISEEIGHLVGLTTLELQHNSITGTIPKGIGKLKQLELLNLYGNQISGVIPSSLGNLTKLSKLFLHENYLYGNIPSSLGNCRQLEYLFLSSNNLTGTIQIEVVSLPKALSLNLSENSLTGLLPLTVGNMIQLVELDVSKNKLSGEIPSTISNCLMLELLSMEDNFLEGSINSSLNRLTGLQILDLSRNNFSGRFPTFLQNFKFLENLNLSFNNFEGEVPREGLFQNTSAFSIIGNSKLCGGTESLGLSACPSGVQNKRRVSIVVKVALPIAISLFLLACLLFALKRMKKLKRKNSTILPRNMQFPKMTYLELSRATNGFSSSNLIGEGSYGSVYKGTLVSDEMVVAVKVLNLKQKGATKSFMAECNAWKNIRHRNLIRVITTCSGIDSQGSDFKALVYEYMPNGSLENYLHRSDNEQLNFGNLSLVQRLNIAIDIAFALEYLHHHCQTSIIHGDLKPSNVLLDHNMTAHLGDFGLAKITQFEIVLDNSLPHQSNSIGIRGTIGYVAPEYGLGSEASTQGDVYSFGIFLLELFMRWRPTDDIFIDDMNLHVLAKEAIPARVREIVEPSLLSEVGDRHIDINNVEDCLISLLRIGVSCSMESPGERMDMRDVVADLCKVKDKISSVNN